MLAIGGLPPVNYINDFAVVPIENAQGEASPVYYTFTIDALVYQESEKTNFTGGITGKPPAAFQAFTDTGTPLHWTPNCALPMRSTPSLILPAVFDSVKNAYVTSCNAKIPEFGVKNWRKKRSLLIHWTSWSQCADNNVNCTSNISDGGEGLQCLGDVFLTNVVAVYDLGANNMRFAQREFY